MEFQKIKKEMLKKTLPSFNFIYEDDDLREITFHGEEGLYKIKRENAYSDSVAVFGPKTKEVATFHVDVETSTGFWGLSFDTKKEACEFSEKNENLNCVISESTTIKVFNGEKYV